MNWNYYVIGGTEDFFMFFQLQKPYILFKHVTSSHTKVVMVMSPVENVHQIQ